MSPRRIGEKEIFFKNLKKQQLYAHKSYKFDDKEKVLERHQLPILTQEEIENMNRLITSKKIKFVIKNLPRKKCPGQDGFTGEFYPIKKKNNQFSIISSRKQRRKHSITHSIDTKILKKILANRSQQHIKKGLHTVTRWNLSQEGKV